MEVGVACYDDTVMGMRKYERFVVYFIKIKLVF